MIQDPLSDQNPYAAPATAPADVAAPLPEARQLVQLPSLALMAVAGIEILLQAITLLFLLVSLASNAGGPKPEDLFAFAAAGAFALVGLGAGAFVLYGAICMRGLRSWGICVAASILAMLPFPCVSCCFVGVPSLLGFPIGIWCLVVLNDGQVKRSFTS